MSRVALQSQCGRLNRDVGPRPIRASLSNSTLSPKEMTVSVRNEDSFGAQSERKEAVLEVQ